MRIGLGVHCQSQLGEDTEHSTLALQESRLYCQSICDIILHGRCISFITDIFDEIKSFYVYRILPVQSFHSIIGESIVCSQNSADVVKLCSFGKIKAPTDTVHLILPFTVSQLFHSISKFRIRPSFIGELNSCLIKHILINHQVCIVIKFSRKSPDFAVIKHVICLGIFTQLFTDIKSDGIQVITVII